MAKACPKDGRITYVLDTNVLLHNPEALFDFKEHEVVLPYVVLGELDEQKKRQDEIGRNARKTSLYLDDLRSLGQLNEGIQVGEGIIRVEVSNINGSSLPKSVPSLNMNKADNLILATAIRLGCGGNNNGKVRGKNKEVVLVTKDINLRVRADVCGVRAEDYRKDRIDCGELYAGFSEIEFTDQQREELERHKLTGLADGQEAHPNEFLVEKGKGDPLIVCCKNGLLVPVNFDKDDAPWGLMPANLGQNMALELLTDNAISVASIIGRAGTGKTLLSLAVGMEAVIEKQYFKKLIVIRPLVPMGNDIGYLPGTKEEKIDPWMRPIYDNLEFLMRDHRDAAGDIEELKKRGVLEIEIMTYIRGRSIPRQFVICDEAQNMSPLMIKTLTTRMGEGSKIVFTGDPEQIDHPYLDASSNGLSYLVERLKGEEISGHVTLTEGVRSKVAEVCSRLL